MKCASRRILKVACLAAGAAVAALVVCLLLWYARSRVVHGPMVQNVTADGFTVVWWARFGGEEQLRVRGVDLADGRFPAIRDGGRYEARAERLDPGRAYHYQIVQVGGQDRSRRLFGGWTSTAKPTSQDFTFIAFADSGYGEEHQYRLAHVLDRYPADLVIHAGDLVYNKGRFRNYPKKFFRPYRDLISSVPFYPVLGNHDVRTDNGGPFLTTFSLPTNGPPSVQAERCYWFDYGNACFVGIDSNLDSNTLAAAVCPWLKQVLGASRGTWKFVFFHHAPWAGGSRTLDPKIAEVLVPTIEESGVDIVFCGHNHLYERTGPMLHGEPSPSNGVIYVTTGAGGKTLHPEKHGDAPYLVTFHDTERSFTWVRVMGLRLQLMQISEYDEIIDAVDVNKRQRSTR